MLKMNRNDEDRKQSNQLLKYSSLGVELIVLMYFAKWGGEWLDKKYGMQNDEFAMGLMLFAIVASLYRLIKTLNYEQKGK